MLKVSNWPICAVCRRPVEKMTRWDDPGTQTATFTVECHGAAETTELTACQVYDAGPNGIQIGLAFRSQAILTQEPVPHD